MGLGCENNNIAEFKKVLATWDDARVRFLNTQDCEDEIEEGKRLIAELRQYAGADCYCRGTESLIPVPGQ